MANGLDTRGGMDGFARGIGMGRQIFDPITQKQRYDDNKKLQAEAVEKADYRYQQGQDDKNAAQVNAEMRHSESMAQQNEVMGMRKTEFNQKQDDRNKKQDIDQLGVYTNSLLTGASFTREDAEQYKILAKKHNMPIGIALNPETKVQLGVVDNFMDKIGQGDSSANINDPQVLGALNYLLRDDINKNKNKNTFMKVIGVAPSPGKDGKGNLDNLVFQLGVFDKKDPSKMLKRVPLTEKRGGEVDGDNNVKNISTETIMGRINAIRTLSHIQDDPARLKQVTSTATSLNLYKPPKRAEYAMVNTDNGVHAINKSNPKDRTFISDVDHANGTGMSSKAYSKKADSFSKDYAKLASFGMDARKEGFGLSGEEVTAETKEYIDYMNRNYNVDMALIPKIIAAKKKSGNTSPLSLKEVAYFTQREYQKNNAPDTTPKAAPPAQELGSGMKLPPKQINEIATSNFDGTGEEAESIIKTLEASLASGNLNPERQAQAKQKKKWLEENLQKIKTSELDKLLNAKATGHVKGQRAVELDNKIANLQQELTPAGMNVQLANK